MRTCPECQQPVEDDARFCGSCGAACAAPSPGADPFVGLTVNGKFKVEALIGQGGMGKVYRARHLTLDRPVVLKMLHRTYSDDPQISQRFQREARAASRLNHPNSIAVLDFGAAEDGTLFMAMEYLPGRDLARVISRGLAAPGGSHRPHRRAGPLGAGRGPRPGDHPPGPQARERHGGAAPRRARLRQGARLRHRQDHRRRRRAQAHGGGAGVRHPRVHEPGAGPRRRPRRPQRPLLGGRHPLPDGDRRPPLPLRHAGGLPHQAPRRGAGGAAAAAAGSLGAARRAHPPGHGEGPGPALPRRRGDARGAAGLRRTAGAPRRRAPPRRPRPPCPSTSAELEPTPVARAVPPPGAAGRRRPGGGCGGGGPGPPPRPRRAGHAGQRGHGRAGPAAPRRPRRSRGPGRPPPRSAAAPEPASPPRPPGGRAAQPPTPARDGRRGPAR